MANPLYGQNKFDDELQDLIDNIPQAAEADLGASAIGGSFDQTEVQAIADKVDALLAKLRTAGIIST